MKTSILLAASLLALTVASPASAASIINFSGDVVTLSDSSVVNLTNDYGQYSGTIPYIFVEKSVALGASPISQLSAYAGTTVQSFLFHFDPLGNNGGDVSGSFGIKLDSATDVVAILSDQLQNLNQTDAVFGYANTIYPNGEAGRGLEGNDSFALGIFTLGTLDGDVQTINYKLRGNGNNIDEVRFIVSTTTPTPAVPEPATWGLMILGFGLIGAAFRYRNVRTSVRFA